MILRLEMIFSAVFYEGKNIFYRKKLKVTKNNTFNKAFSREFFLAVALATF